MRWADQLQNALFRRREKYIELLDLSVKSPRLELRKDPFGILLVIRRADVMRTGTQPLHGVTHDLGVGNGAHLGFPVAFRTGTGSREPIKWFFRSIGGK